MKEDILTILKAKSGFFRHFTHNISLISSSIIGGACEDCRALFYSLPGSHQKYISWYFSGLFQGVQYPQCSEVSRLENNTGVLI